jgi:hypothetical protein
MNAFLAVLSSATFWGIVVGTVIALGSSVFLSRLNERSYRRVRRVNTLLFLRSIVQNVADGVDELNAHRRSSNVIWFDLIDLIRIETQTYVGQKANVYLEREDEVVDRVDRFIRRLNLCLSRCRTSLEQYYKLSAETKDGTKNADASKRERVADMLSQANAFADDLNLLSQEARSLADQITARVRR